jgi:hypothetical protein
MTFGDSLPGWATGHVACHATFEANNPMFSALLLGDGDFNIYDLERIGRPPDLMVLSACDSGYTDMRAGAELTGLTLALLSLGTKTVVASIGLVPDSGATANLMLSFTVALQEVFRHPAPSLRPNRRRWPMHTAISRQAIPLCWSRLSPGSLPNPEPLQRRLATESP